jgi:hypothetical protein
MLAAVASVGCGARTGLRVEDEPADAAPLDSGTDAGVDAGRDAAPDASDADAEVDAAPPECVIDADCRFKAAFCTPFLCVRGVCLAQPAPACDDNDRCTDDRCDPVSDRCVSTPRTFDTDGDGFNGPLPGTQPGAPDACGNDCNDRNPSIFPGAVDLCNGVDDNCDKRIDEDARYQVVGAEVRLSPSTASIAQVTGVTSTPSGFFLGYSAALTGATRFSPFGARLDATLARQGTDLDITALSPADGDGARAAWAGDRYGLVWSDRRNGNYEVFFALANAGLQKLAPGDVRLTNSSGFSIYPSVTWTGRDFLVVWQEERGGYDIVASRVAADASSASPPVTIRADRDSRNVAIVALPGGGYVLAWLEGSTVGPVVTARVNVMLLSEALVPMTGPVTPIAGVVNGGPALTLVDGKIAVAAHANSGVASVAVLDASNLATVATTELTNGQNSFGRDVALLGVGNRLAVAWADDRDDQRTFEIYLQTFDGALRPSAPAARVTNAIGDSASPVLAPLGAADAMIAWNDGRTGRWQVYGRALQCASPPVR